MLYVIDVYIDLMVVRQEKNQSMCRPCYFFNTLAHLFLHQHRTLESPKEHDAKLKKGDGRSKKGAGRSRTGEKKFENVECQPKTNGNLSATIANINMDVDLMFMPLNNDSHWHLLVINMNEKEL
ncbi:hypothetical protein H6P81_013308 [Aristolochia fimbriata]|uniref:Ubiquitin-like protease family profile domain-containing protein n=1 Tax=Aristolochia fimbriata TaxID=158543 RepID=A0AAV7EEC4_ARIFI|nr:hypothetical protein H6P81_013308 [Aristolochia fimbriata]